MSIPSESVHQSAAENEDAAQHSPEAASHGAGNEASVPGGDGFSSSSALQAENHPPESLSAPGPAFSPDEPALPAPDDQGSEFHSALSAAPVEPEAIPSGVGGGSPHVEDTQMPAPPDPNSEPSDPDKIVSIPEDPMGEALQPDLAFAAGTGHPAFGEQSAPGTTADSHTSLDAAEAAESIVPDLDLAPGDDTVTHSWPGHQTEAHSDTSHEIHGETPGESGGGASVSTGIAAAVGAAAVAGVSAVVGAMFGGKSPEPTEIAHEESGPKQESALPESNTQSDTQGKDTAATPDEEYGRPPADLDEGSAETAWEPDAPVSQDFDKTWQRIEDAYNEKRALTAMVVDRVKGGLVVDIGMQGFVPASQVASGKIHDLERFIGRPLKLRITDLDRERQRVVLSARIVQEEDHLRRKRETLEKLKVGLIADGVVRRLTDFGAFVDIGGIDGLLHVSEMSWSRVKHPKEAVSPGEHVKVKVLKISDDRKKISLGMRQLLPDPWNSIESNYKVGDMVSGKVVRVVPFGAFIQIKDGVDAILPNSEVTARKPKTEDLPQIGDTINAKIIEVRAEARRMTLSLRRIQEEQDRKEYREHVQTTTSQATARKTTIGDMFGDILNDWSGDEDKA